MSVNLVTVCGPHYATLPAMLEHYRQWVDDIIVAIHLGERNIQLIGEIEAIVAAAGGVVHRVCCGALHDWPQVTSLYNETTLLKPDDWWIVADIDELHVYPQPVGQIIQQCEDRGYHFVTGGFLDRLGPDGSLPVIQPDEPLWSQFPLAGFFRFPISGACPNKVVLMKGHVRLSNGQHYAIVDGKEVRTQRYAQRALGVSHPWRYPPDECFVQVHHFKWDASVINRMKLILEHHCPYSFYWEYEKVLAYLEQHARKIALDNESFRLHLCGREYADYPDWQLIRQVCLNE